MSVVMDRIVRPLTGRRPVVQPKPRIEVEHLTRLSNTAFVARVRYTYKDATWVERVHFAWSHNVPEGRVIRVTDADYPHDRAKAVYIANGVDMRVFVVGFILAGRW